MCIFFTISVKYRLLREIKFCSMKFSRSLIDMDFFNVYLRFKLKIRRNPEIVANNKHLIKVSFSPR